MVEQLNITEASRLRLLPHDAMGFLMIMRGSVNIKGLGKMNLDNLVLCKPQQVLDLEFTGGRIPLSALWVQIPLSKIQNCSTEKTDLLAAFHLNPAPQAMVYVASGTLMLAKSLAMQLMHLPGAKIQYAVDVMEQATISMFLVLVLQSFAALDPHMVKQKNPGKSQFSLDEVFRYIHDHLTEDLTLELLEKEFFVSRSHLIREFKKRTGQTVHSYIVRARLDLCRSYIEQGYSITEVYRKGGFGGYNHFFKAFRKVYGMTPKEYYLLHIPNSKKDASYP